MKRIIALLSFFIIYANINLNAQELQEAAKSNLSEANKLKSEVTSLKNQWQTRGFAGITFNQNYFSNWAKGGENSYAAIGNFNYDINYRSLDTNHIWKTNINLGYGLLYTTEFGTRKAEDKLNLESKYGYRAISNLYYSALLSFKSQFAKGYNYPNDSDVVSNLFSPAYTILSVGIDYKPLPFLSLYISPLTGKHIMVLDQELANAGAFGVDPAVYDSLGNMLTPGKNHLINLGAYLVANLDYEIMKNINLKSKLELFNNYTAKSKRDRNKIIVNCENTLMMKINNYISANLFLHLIYDYQNPITQYETIDGVKTAKGVAPRLQIKENFGLGFGVYF